MYCTTHPFVSLKIGQLCPYSEFANTFANEPFGTRHHRRIPDGTITGIRSVRQASDSSRRTLMPEVICLAGTNESC